MLLNPLASITSFESNSILPLGVLATIPAILFERDITDCTSLLTDISAPSLAASVARYW